MTEQAKRIPAIAVECITDNIPSQDRVSVSGGGRHLFTLAVDMLTPEILRYAVLHGLKQKLVDAAAISRNPDTGRSATVDDKVAAVNEIFARLVAGEWNKRREGGAGTGGMLFRALCIMFPDKPADAVREFLAKKSDAEKAALRRNPKVAAIMDTLRDEGDVDSDALLGELDD